MNLRSVSPTEDVKESGRRAVLFRTCACITLQTHLPRRPTGVEIGVILPLFMWDVGTPASQRALAGCRKTNLFKIPPQKAWQIFFLFNLPHTLFGEHASSILWSTMVPTSWASDVANTSVICRITSAIAELLVALGSQK